ncbi:MULTISPECIES: hypothetical protein [Pseudomonas]|uniref:Flagella biosynthesis regulator n=1 Tax=Pseudomonas fluorescens TaxID=294 RepID=A0A109L054_PSEFL|nr:MULTISPECIES: hypothetical protein [Pseudomonas]KWV78604.1 flagella biosynthesis regulator [Pseudomonas fluorescens]MBA1297765.1 hypothetical protein [Pseudomonas carnis]MDH0796261.1 hypothetical protein [Pseudomonas carnis]QHA99095.1 hypothetical protein FXO12_20980 [Pseudomonas sp. J380]
MRDVDEKLNKISTRLAENFSSFPLAHDETPPSHIKVKGNNTNINFGTQLNFPKKPIPRTLLAAQRKELHELREACEELGDDPREAWRSVHVQLSVNSIDEICADDFHKARDVFSARLEQLREAADKRRLIGKILRAVAEKDAKKEMNNFCDVTFGRTQLTHLKRAELQQVLGFIQTFQIRPMHPSTMGEQSRAALPFKEFLVTYKWNSFGLFVFGILVGRFWF